MKKTILLIAAMLLISVSVFSMGMKNSEKEEKGSNYQGQCIEKSERGDHFKKRFENLTPEKKAEVEKIQKKYETDEKKLALEIKEKNIAVDKLLLEEKVDWTKVEKAVNDVSASKAKFRVLHLKKRTEMKQVLGDDFFGGFGKHMRHSNMH